MSRLNQIVLGLVILSGMIAGTQAQTSATSTCTSSVTIASANDGGIVIRHNPFFGMEGSPYEAVKYSGSAAKISASVSGGTASVIALGEPGYEVNVCVSLTSEMVSRDGSGSKLRGGVNLEDSHERFSNRTSAQLSGSDGQMKFLLSAMSPDASVPMNGVYTGNYDVILTYN